MNIFWTCYGDLLPRYLCSFTESYGTSSDLLALFYVKCNDLWGFYTTQCCEDIAAWWNKGNMFIHSIFGQAT